LFTRLSGDSARDILVVGAGPTGLFLGCELARRGLRPRIIDRRLGPDQLSKAVGLHARTLEIFEELGITDTVVNEGVRIHTLDVREGPALRARLDFAMADSDYAYAVDLPQHRTETLLRDKLREFGVDVEWGVELTELRADRDGVEVTLQGAAGAATSKVGWVCGCDGVRSTVRTLSGISYDGDEDPEGWALIEGTLEWDLSAGAWHLFMGNDGVLVVCPIPGGGYRIAADMQHVAEAHATAPTLAEFQKVVAERTPPGCVMGEIEWASPFRIHERLASTFSRGRVFLAGDAAHTQSPAAAQGLNTGIHDAFNLGWKLAMVTSGTAHPALLATYDAERRQIARGSISFTHALTRLVAIQGPGADLMRDTVSLLGARVPGLFRYLIDRMAEVHLCYRDSAIVVDRLHRRLTAHHVVHAGDRVPDVALPDAGCTLHQLLRGRDHVVLSLGSNGLALSTGGAFDHVALEGADAAAVATRLGTSDPAWVVIRPDCHIGFLGRAGDRAGIATYAERLLSASSGRARPS
jgi:2-polyprenyl-6-methoxyphenol hydroxylase-like FAD-dependent oxidoreductase